MSTTSKKSSVVSCSEVGIAVSQKDLGVSSVRWEDIARIDVFKRDALIFDVICMDICDNKGTHLFLDEEAAGWPQFVDAIPIYLPECPKPDDWVPIVSTPAFELSWRTIYYRYSIARPK